MTTPTIPKLTELAFFLSKNAELIEQVIYRTSGKFAETDTEGIR